MPSDDPSPGDRGPRPVDWAWHRDRLIKSGDEEALAWLDELLVRPVEERPPDYRILDMLSRREHVWELRAQIQPCIDADASTPVGVCNRWNMLSPWAGRFARSVGGRKVINFGCDGSSFGLVGAARMVQPEQGELPAPELAWAEAFLGATKALVPLVLDKNLDDVVVQALVRGMEEVLDGKPVEVATHVREVDLIVRVLLDRLSKPAVIPASSVVSQSARAATATPASLSATQPTLAEFQRMVPRVMHALQVFLFGKGAAEQGGDDEDDGTISLGTLATSKDPLPTAVRWGKQYLELLADRIFEIGVPPVTLDIGPKVIKSTSATATLYALCNLVFQMAVSVAADPKLQGRDEEQAGALGAAVKLVHFQRITNQVQIELGLLVERQRPDQAERDASAHPAESKGPKLGKVEQAIALLLGDGRNPRSMRQYAEDVGLNHSVLSRDDRFRAAYEVATSLAKKDKADLPTGEKDKEGNLEAEAPPALCENCRQEPIWKAVVVNGESMGLCEKCASKHG